MVSLLPITHRNVVRSSLFLLIALGTSACGSSDESSSASGDSATVGDGNNIDTGGGTTGDSASTGDSGSTGDTSSLGDSGSTGDTSSLDGSTAKTDPVNLGKAGTFAILAKTGISTVPTSAITGDLGISPAAASYITGFSLTADSTNLFARSPQVTGKVFASNYAAPTPTTLTTAIGDMQLAYTDAAGRAPKVTELGAGNIGGKTLTAGVYKWGTGLLIPTNVTFNGNATDVWILQIAQNLTVSNGTRITLTGGALAKNVFWQVAGAAELGTTAHLEGVVMSQTSITLRTGSSVNGRLLAQSAVSIDGSTVVAPAP